MIAKPNWPSRKDQCTRTASRILPCPENLVVRGEVDVAKLQQALKRSGLSKSELARRMNWMRVKPDVHRVNQYFGLERLSNGERRKKVTYEVALKLCKALNSSPIDLGI
jgi:hypothetical protein